MSAPGEGARRAELRRRETVYRGVRRVDGLLFHDLDPAWILENWEQGSSLRRLADGAIVLRFATPRMMRCELASGLALIDEGGVLTGAPVEVEPGPRPAVLVRYRGGELVAASGGAPVPTAEFLTLDGWHVVRLGPPSPPPPPEPPAEPPPALEPRPVELRPQPTDPTSSPKPGEPGEPGESAPRERRWWRGRGARGPEAATGDAQPGPPDTRGWSPRDHERYLAELVRLFDRGQVDDALLRAIPMGRPGDKEVQRELGRLPSLPPLIRDKLTIGLTTTWANSSIDGGEAVTAELKQRYRHTVSQLESEGRVRDAAFVLADLLDATEEALALLERHGEYELAAQVAEGRAADPEVAVRLWWLARDHRRALTVARRHGCYRGAILRLERGHRTEAEELRFAWSDDLLAAGDLLGALDAVDPVPDSPARRARRAEVLVLGNLAEGPLRARLLARRLRFDEPDVAPETLAVIDGEDAPLRRHLAEELTLTDRAIDHPWVAKRLFRRCAADGAVPTAKELAPLAEDRVLAFELRKGLSSGSSVGGELPWPAVLRRDAEDRGQLAAHDVRVLPDGRVVLALGAIGIRILRPDGRIEVDLDAPATHLVLSDAGTKLLAIAVLDENTVSVRAVDLLTRRVSQIGEVTASHWADDYDGATWFVGFGTRVWMLDLTSTPAASLWREAGDPSPLVDLVRSASKLKVLRFLQWVDADGAMLASLRTYRLPGLEPDETLQPLVRPGHRLAADGGFQFGIAAGGGYTVEVGTVPGGGVGVLAWIVNSRTQPIVALELPGMSTVRTHLSGAGLLAVTDDLGRIEIVDLTTRSSRLSTRIRL